MNPGGKEVRFRASIPRAHYIGPCIVWTIVAWMVSGVGYVYAGLVGCLGLGTAISVLICGLYFALWRLDEHVELTDENLCLYTVRHSIEVPLANIECVVGFSENDADEKYYTVAVLLRNGSLCAWPLMAGLWLIVKNACRTGDIRFLQGREARDMALSRGFRKRPWT